ncbi:MAG: hypothetical protein JSR44_09435 [Spirochaetes bacterium]|nr:hypothetical protein [Spirochaetota bacterium]
MVRLLLSATLLCAPLAAADAPHIWVAHEFVGGPKCVASGPVSHYTAPGFDAEKKRLRAQGVAIFREYFVDKATCQACYKCPNYARTIFFEIGDASRTVALKAGYNSVAAPSTDELKDFERRKKYQPPPDIPQDD